MERENQIHLNKAILLRKISEGDFSYCIELLREEFKLKRTVDNSLITKYPSKDTITVLGELLSRLAVEFSNDQAFKDALLLTKQCFQSLRNCSVNGQEVQNTISNNSNIIENSYVLFESLLEKNDSEYLECLGMELQFLCNLTVSNPETQVFVWEKYYTLLKAALVRSEVAHVVTMIIYNILKQHDKLIPTDVGFISDVLEMHSKCIENVSLLMDLLVAKNVITNTYNQLSNRGKILILESLHQSFVEDNSQVPHDLILVLAAQFKQKSNSVLKTVADDLDNIDPIEVARLLDCLASASGKDIYLPQMQQDTSLLLNCLHMLQMIHSLGKQGENNFTALQKLADFNPGDKAAIQDHPIFGFKANLIRVIGNLCHKHRVNQDLVQELHGIPLILECCNIDARNPLIMQWAIFSIRNLCEGNAEIQAEIAKLTKVGIVDSAVLHEMGLTLHNDGEDKICIAPLNLNK